MLRQALAPDMVNYSALISAWEKGEELRWAFDVFAAMLRPALVPSLIRDMHLEVDSGIMPSRQRTGMGPPLPWRQSRRLIPTQHRPHTLVSE